jgi:hypothetical protein
MAFQRHPAQPNVRVRPRTAAHLFVHLLGARLFRGVFRPENSTGKDAATYSNLGPVFRPCWHSRAPHALMSETRTSSPHAAGKTARKRSPVGKGLKELTHCKLGRAELRTKQATALPAKRRRGQCE